MLFLKYGKVYNQFMHLKSTFHFQVQSLNYDILGGYIVPLRDGSLSKRCIFITQLMFPVSI